MASMLNFMERTLTTLFVKEQFKVTETSKSSFKKHGIVDSKENLILYKDQNGEHTLLLLKDKGDSKGFSLFTAVSDTTDVTDLYNAVQRQLLPLLAVPSPIIHYNVKSLQKMIDVLVENRGWGPAHIAAYFNHSTSILHPSILQDVNYQCQVSGMTPLMACIQQEHASLVKELVTGRHVTETEFHTLDIAGNSVLHYAARVKKPDILRLLVKVYPFGLDLCNSDGEAVVHIAIMSGNLENLKVAIEHNADLAIPTATVPALHCACDVDDMALIQLVLQQSPRQVLMVDGKHGSYPLHWTKSSLVVDLLCEKGADINASSAAGERAIHVALKKGRHHLVISLLSHSADVTSLSGGVEGLAGSVNPLHCVAKAGLPELVRAMVVFAADANAKTSEGVTARHIASTSGHSKDVAAEMVALLHPFGARRCAPSQTGCSALCSASGTDDGKLSRSPAAENAVQETLDSLLSDAALENLYQRALAQEKIPGTAVLALDGGGIRGLILAQTLIALDDALKKRGTRLLDHITWLAGTSTGAILSSAVVYGIDVKKARGLVFRMKDNIFCGKRPYSSEPLENFLKTEIGEKTTMMAVQHPRLMITGLLADRHPPELHFFRNYSSPANILGMPEPINVSPDKFPATTDPENQLVWRAARSSGAAPSYFRSCGRFIDGGLIANNPTLDALTEISQYNAALTASGRGKEVKRPALVISCGTGRMPQTSVNGVDVFRPEGVFDVAKTFTGSINLINLLVEQVSSSDGRVIERARAWCNDTGIAYVRLNPPLSFDAQLDETGNGPCLEMMWETQVYLWRRQKTVDMLATILSQMDTAASGN